MSIAILLAAGRSKRFRSDKLWEPLGDRPVIQHSLECFALHPGIAQLVVVHAAEDRQRVQDLAQKITQEHRREVALVQGGATRCDSTWQALRALKERGASGAVLIHDTARPLVSAALITRCLEVLESHRGVCPVAPVVNTVMKHNGEFLLNPLERWELGSCQTPQGFEFELIYAAHRSLQERPQDIPQMTDDCSVLLRHNPQQAIRTIAAPRENIKITQPMDLKLARLLLEESEEK